MRRPRERTEGESSRTKAVAEESQLPSLTETWLPATVGPLAVIRFSGPPGTGRMRLASSVVNSSVRTRLTHEPLSMDQVRLMLAERSGVAGNQVRARVPNWDCRRCALVRAPLLATLSASLVGMCAGPLCCLGAGK